MRLKSIVLSMASSAIAVSCQGKKCTQYTEVKSSFINLTGASQNILLDLVVNGAVQTKAITLMPTAAPQVTLLSSYSYEKDPTHTGKVDFNPKDAQCSASETTSEPMQLSDPQMKSIKLCFGDAYENKSQDVYVVNGASACPYGSSAVIRW